MAIELLVASTAAVKSDVVISIDSTFSEESAPSVAPERSNEIGNASPDLICARETGLSLDTHTTAADDWPAAKTEGERVRAGAICSGFCSAATTDVATSAQSANETAASERMREDPFRVSGWSGLAGCEFAA